MKCMVKCCRYRAEGTIEASVSFAVCPLHDAPQVRQMIELGMHPHAYWSSGRPIVLPSGALDVRELQVVEGDFQRAFDDPRLAEVNDTPTVMVMEQYDLTRR